MSLLAEACRRPVETHDREADERKLEDDGQQEGAQTRAQGGARMMGSRPGGDGRCCRPAVATMSLGSADRHGLETKLEAAAAWGFHGIELFWPDLEAFAGGWAPGADLAPGRRIPAAARHLGRLCRRLGLEVVSLQPFRNYDGLLDRGLHARRIREFGLWLEVAGELGAGLIGVPSALPGPPGGPARHTGDPAAIAADLGELAALAEPHGIRIAYENLCFGARVQSWPQAWEIIGRTGRPDGVCFLPDTFNLSAGIVADPARPGVRLPAGARALEASLRRLTRAVPLDSMPLLQVADAELLAAPLTDDHPWLAGGLSPRMAWSRKGRLFPLEEGGCLPVLAVVEALAAAGWRGWVSAEVFSRTTEREGDETIWEHARRAWQAWQKLACSMGWDAKPARPGDDDDQ